MKKYIPIVILSILFTGCSINKEKKEMTDTNKSNPDIGNPETIKDINTTISIPEPTNQVNPEPTNPVNPEPTNPVNPESTNPVKPEPTNPVKPEPTNPVKPEPTNPVNPEPVNDCEKGEGMVYGKVINYSEKGVPNVLININGCKTISDNEGNYKFENIKTSEKSFVKFTSEKYATAYVPIKIEKFYEDTNTPSKNYVTTLLTDYSTNQDTHIQLPTSINKNETISYFRYSRVNTKNERRNFPGEFKGFDENNEKVFFESFGLIEMRMTDKNKNNISLQEPMKLIFNEQPTLTENTIPLWKFNDKEKKWEYYGNVDRQENGKFTAMVDDFGIYSMSRPFKEPTGMYIGRIIYKDESPAKDLRVHLTGKNWISTALTTDENGEFEIEVKANTDFSIYAFTYKDNYIAEYSGPKLTNVEPGEIVDDRT